MSKLTSQDIGGVLRQLRKARGLTLEQAAQTAGLSRSTVNRWETGVNQPRLIELNALLETLGASTTQKRDVIAGMDVPRAHRQVHAEVTRIAEQVGISPKPNGGDLLRALRLRRGLSTEEAASRMNVTARTVQRWEKAEVWPSTEQLHTLCYLLQAHEDEVVALTCGLFSASSQPPSRPLSFDALEQQRRLLRDQILSGEPALIELHCLTLEAQVWPLAVQTELGRELLAHTYTLHALYLIQRERAGAGRNAEYALDVLSGRSPNEPYQLQAGVFDALHNTPHSPRHKIDALRRWLSLARWRYVKAWILSEIAWFLVEDGAVEEGVNLGAEACRIAERSERPGEHNHRLNAQAQILMQVGRPAEALELIRDLEEDKPYYSSPLMLLRAEAHLATGDSMEARGCLQRALSEIERYDLAHLREKAEILAAQL